MNKFATVFNLAVEARVFHKLAAICLQIDKEAGALTDYAQGPAPYPTQTAIGDNIRKKLGPDVLDRVEDTRKFDHAPRNKGLVKSMAPNAVAPIVPMPPAPAPATHVPNGQSVINQGRGVTGSAAETARISAKAGIMKAIPQEAEGIMGRLAKILSKVRG
jgi:hypothetical protein